VIPLFHGQALVPLYELALMQAEAFCAKNHLQIVGFYSLVYQPNKLSGIITRFAEKVQEQYPSACILLMDDFEIYSSLDESLPPLKVFSSSNESKQWKFLKSLELDSSILPSIKKSLKDNSFLKLADFSDHLDDITKDWFHNGSITKE